MLLLEALKKYHLGTLSKICLWLRPSASPSGLIKVNKWDYLKNHTYKLK